MKAERRGRRRKVFAAPGKKFLAEFIHPLRDDRPVLQTALREESLREGPPCCGQNEHTRHGGTACRPWNAGSFIAGMVKAAHPVRMQQARRCPQPSDRMAQTRRGSAETGRCAAAALAESKGDIRMLKLCLLKRSHHCREEDGEIAERKDWRCFSGASLSWHRRRGLF